MTITSLLFLSLCSIFITSEICLQLFRCIGVQDIESLSSCGELPYSLSAYVMPWQFLSLPLFFRALTTSILSCPAVFSIYETYHKKFETTLLATSWKFPKPKPVYFKTGLAKTDHTSTHLCFSPLADHWFTNTVQTRFSASTRPLLVSWLNFYKPTRQLRSSSGTSILYLPSVLTLLLLLVKTQIMPVEGMELYKMAVTNGHTWNPRWENLNRIDITPISLRIIVMPTVFLTLDTKTT